MPLRSATSGFRYVYQLESRSAEGGFRQRPRRGPTAAWGNAPGSHRQTRQGLKARPIPMPQSLDDVLLHLVFSTRDRFPCLGASVRPALHASLATVARRRWSGLSALGVWGSETWGVAPRFTPTTSPPTPRPHQGADSGSKLAHFAHAWTPFIPSSGRTRGVKLSRSFAFWLETTPCPS